MRKSTGQERLIDDLQVTLVLKVKHGKIIIRLREDTVIQRWKHLNFEETKI